MAILAIQGHSTRGKEVIKILEMLGGVNPLNYDGSNTKKYYFVKNHIICKSYGRKSEDSISYPVEYYTLEEFLGRFPYRVSDEVLLDKFPCTVLEMNWSVDKVIYYVQGRDFTKRVYAKDLKLNRKNLKMKSLIDVLKEKNVGVGDKLYSRVLGTVFFVDVVYNHPINQNPCNLIRVRAYSNENHPTNYYFSEYGRLMLNFSGHEYSYEQDLFLSENCKEEVVNHEEFQFKEGSIIYDKVYGSTYIFKSYDRSTNTLYYYARCLMNGDLCYSGKSLFEGNIRRTHEGFISSDNFRLATEYEKARVYSSLHQAGYMWDIKRLKLVPISINRPDVSSKFKTFDHVLVRDLDSDVWTPDFYFSYNHTPTNECSEGILHTPFRTVLGDRYWAQCIPFNSETKHLIDTNLACPEKYVIW